MIVTGDTRTERLLPGGQQCDHVVGEDSESVVVTGVVEERQEGEHSTGNTLHLHLAVPRPDHLPVHLVGVAPHPRLVPEHHQGHLLLLHLLIFQEADREETLRHEEAADRQLQPLRQHQLSLVGQQRVEAGDRIKT